MAVVQQLTLFEKPKTPAQPKARKAKKRGTGPAALARGEFEPVNPPNLAQDTALWLLGQRSIAAQRGNRYVRESMKHPGKMQPYVAGAIFDTYISPGSFVVDAMGGIATTNVEGMERGHTVVCVELVRRWAEVAAQNVELTRRRGAPGKGAVIWGDARALPELLQQLVDATVMSPPFGDSNVRQMPSDFGESGPGGHFSDPHRGYDAALLSPPFGEGREPGKPPGPAEPRAGEWSEYENGAGPSPGWRGLESRTYSPSNNEGRQVDATLFSPPFGPTQTGRGLVLTGFDTDKRTPAEKGVGVRYDAMIASPAYGDIRQDGGQHQFGSNSAMDNYTGEVRVKHRAQRDPSNVGNKKYGTMKQGLAMVERLKRGETVPPEEWPKLCYLEDMALIYWHCLNTLKDGGLCILVLKDYRRKKARVNLVGDTITLMEAVGFTYHDRALAVTSKVEGAKVVAKVSPFVRLNARKPEKNGGAVMLPVGEEVLVYRKEAKKR